MLLPLVNSVAIEVLCGDPVTFLSLCNKRGIILRHVAYKDGLTMTMILERKDYDAFRIIAQKYGAEIRVKYLHGLYWSVRKSLDRPVLLLGICLLLLINIFLPTRVLFIMVEGNDKIPANYILEQADACGISFGTSRRNLRSEQMKNMLLSAIPELQWAGINTYGCTAVISVRERSASEIEKIFGGISSIVAERDGIIEMCTSVKGNLLCKVGQAVKKGDVLISGYMDLGLCVKATQAEGEVFAQTKHDLTVVMPMAAMEKSSYTETNKRVGLLIGKKRVYLLKDSRISGSSCDKIYKEHYLTLPGGFSLPFGWFVCTVTTCDNLSIDLVDNVDFEQLKNAGRMYLLSQMVSGQILYENFRFLQSDGIYVLSGNLICSEMIGRIRQEEIIQHYGEDNGKNSER